MHFESQNILNKLNNVFIGAYLITLFYFVILWIFVDCKYLNIFKTSATYRNTVQFIMHPRPPGRHIGIDG